MTEAKAPAISPVWKSHILQALFMCIVPVLLAIVFAWPRIDTEIIVGGFEMTDRVTPLTADIETEHYKRTEIFINSRSNESMAAWVYLPFYTAGKSGEKSKTPAWAAKETPGADYVKPPVVVMAHGFGAQKDFGLHKYADHFASNGLAVVVFDYRTFGGSFGLPRHWVSPHRHLDDWKDVATYVVETNVGGQVDGSRLLLWGTSFSGGHALVTAAFMKEQVKAVVAQVPHLSGSDASKSVFKKRGIIGAARMLMAGLHDVFGEDFGFEPAYVKIAGRHGELAFMQLSDEELEAYHSRHPEVKQGGWRNMARARFSLESSGYNPIHFLKWITSPVLLVSATRDSLCPPEVVSKAVGILQERATHAQYDADHFGLGGDAVFPDLIARTTEFMLKAVAM